MSSGQVRLGFWQKKILVFQEVLDFGDEVRHSGPVFSSPILSVSTQWQYGYRKMIRFRLGEPALGTIYSLCDPVEVACISISLCSLI